MPHSTSLFMSRLTSPGHLGHRCVRGEGRAPPAGVQRLLHRLPQLVQTTISSVTGWPLSQDGEVTRSGRSCNPRGADSSEELRIERRRKHGSVRAPRPIARSVRQQPRATSRWRLRVSLPGLRSVCQLAIGLVRSPREADRNHGVTTWLTLPPPRSASPHDLSGGAGALLFEISRGACSSTEPAST